jgi:hypothetical protein
LSNRAQEALFALVLDSDGRPLSVLLHSIGGPMQNAVYLLSSYSEGKESQEDIFLAEPFFSPG